MSILTSGTSRFDATRIEEVIGARFPAGPLGAVVTSSSARAMFTLADFSVYVALIDRLRETGVNAATTNLNINFLAKPKARVAWGEAELFSEGWPRCSSTPLPPMRYRYKAEGNILPSIR